MGNPLDQCSGFVWDNDNLLKNEIKHGVDWIECEQIFFNRPLIINDDFAHGDFEERYLALGRTDQGRRLFLVFTIKKHAIRVISARDMTKREKAHYEKHR
jgi:uncharacterized protein